MIKEILMIYVFIPAMITIVLNEDPVIRGFCSAVCFGAGMLAMRFIVIGVRNDNQAK